VHGGDRPRPVDLAMAAEIADPDQLIELAVLGVLLGDQLRSALRRLADADLSARRMRPMPPE
jgi:hypothetical protein